VDRETYAPTVIATSESRREPAGDEPQAAAAPGAVRAARAALWLAATLPFIYSTSKNASALAAGGGLGPLEIVRGGGPAALWALSLCLAPTLRRGVGVVEIALGAFSTVILMSVLIPGNPSPQGSLLKSVSMVFVLLSLARLARMYPSPRDALVGLSGFVHLVLLAAVVQVVLFRHTVYAVGPDTIDNLPRLNILVPQVSANPLALVAVAGILSCVLGVGPRWLPFNPLVRNGLIVLYVYVIILTRTRSALLVGLIVILLALAARARRRPLSTVAITAALVLAAVLVVPAVLPEVHSFIQRGQTAQGIDTLSGRTVVWNHAWHVWQDNKVFGLGYYTGHRLGIEGLSETQSNIDNTWLETLVDVGLIGLIPLVLFATSGLVRLVRSRELTGDWKLWALGTVAYGLAISFVNPTIQTPGAGQVILAFLLMVVLPSRRPAEAG
jgi:O-antigen ligase